MQQVHIFSSSPPSSKMLLPSEHRFWVSALSATVCFLSAASAGLRYNYGDGSFYVGQVDEKGRPDGVGKYFNTSGALGKYACIPNCINGIKLSPSRTFLLQYI